MDLEKVQVNEVKPVTLSVEQRPQLQWITSKVHDDDVHGLCKVEVKGRSILISGSKDCTIRRHELATGSLTCPGRVMAQPRNPNYEQWITGLDTFSDGSWIAGSRNGFVQCSDALGEYSYYRGFPLKTDVAHAQAYKSRNEYRITGLHCLKNDDSPEKFHCLIGYPESFCQFDLTTQKVVRFFQFSSAQWVYGFCPVRPGVIATIHGTSLSLLQEEAKTWKMLRPIVRQPEVSRGEQIPFISSIEGIPTSSSAEPVSAIALSYFGGRTEIRDVEIGSVVYAGHEHTARVWQSMPYAPVSYVSCADDKTIKIWDTRRRASVATLAGHPGRVSSLCFLDSSRFVAATCPDNPHASDSGAQFYYYDLRSIGSGQPTASSLGGAPGIDTALAALRIE